MIIELKEFFKPRDLTHIEGRLKLSTLRFHQPYPSRRINSLYFDTINLDSLEESIEGSSSRKKVRLRWYGKEVSPSLATLEIKRKQGVFSWKKLYANQFKVIPAAVSWNNFITPRRKCNPSALLAVKNLRPTSIVSYERKYFASFENKVRITIDWNLRTFDQRHSSKPNLRLGRDHLNQIIVEAKVHAADQGLLDTVFNQLPFSPKRFSKYCESLLPQNYL
jgi:SPX domain protein involved in polyphosphate accumulation